MKISQLGGPARTVRRRSSWRRLIAAVGLALIPVIGLTASAQASSVVAFWNFNELPATPTPVLLDSGPNGLNGTIGTSITLNGFYHSFPLVKRGVGGTVDPQHLDVINSALLNPGTSDFMVTVRLRVANLAQSFGNVMQKGQTGSPTGYWKIELDGGTGRVFCGFVSPTGSGGIRSPIVIADNNWHMVTCERGPGFVSTTVDGVSSRINHAVGNIVNNNPLTIGGKLNCNATLTHLCDYFIGQIDYVEIQSG